MSVPPELRLAQALRTYRIQKVTTVILEVMPRTAQSALAG
jgi:hypothetical protein